LVGACISTLRQGLASKRDLGIVKVGADLVPDFGQHPEVIRDCTDWFAQVLGEGCRPARSAVGMGSLLRGIAVEVEAVVLAKGT
jgi:enamine deaminase RidA (YjgF/YER057c/UK114 family)